MSIVQLSLGWRSSKNNPLTLGEINNLNRLLLDLKIKIPELHNTQFQDGLAKNTFQPESSVKMETYEKIALLKASLLSISNLDPQRRGFEFEKFLNECFSIFELHPRPSFRLKGEQIDGSFQLNDETYLMEAKWQAPPIGNRELQSFSGTVKTKSQWSRGLYISYSGFSPEGLIAFSQGSATALICMTGHELCEILDLRISLSEVLALKTRRAAETGKAFTELSLL